MTRLPVPPPRGRHDRRRDADPARDARVIAGFVAAAEAAPEELSTIANVMPAPPLPFLPAEHARPARRHGACSPTPATLEAASAPSRRSARWPRPLADMVRPMPYPEIYPPEHGGLPPASRSSRTMFVDASTASAAETIVERLAGLDRADARSRSCACSAARWPACRRTRPPSPIATSRIMVNVAAFYDAPRASAPSTQAWVAGFARALRRGRRRRLRRLPRPTRAQERVRAAYPGATWDRLAAIKAPLRPGQPLPPQPEHPAVLLLVPPWRPRAGAAAAAAAPRPTVTPSRPPPPAVPRQPVPRRRTRRPAPPPPLRRGRRRGTRRGSRRPGP